MKVHKKILATLLFVILACSSLMSQTSISGGDLNKYTSIEELLFLEGSTIPNAVKVSDISDFDKGDTVMVYQPKGFEVSETVPGEIQGFVGYTGKYSILIIDTLYADTVVFNAPTGFTFPPASNPYRAGEVGQLIKVATFENAVVTGTLSAKEWDPVTNTGGVLVLYIKETLTLEADIDVSGQGFKGADPSGDVYGTGLCYADDEPGLDNYFYREDSMSRAGLKGEGAIDTTFHKLRGRSNVVNGGGGGNARYSGGGGGSNFSIGNKGGLESDVCGTPSDIVMGEGGLEFGSSLYKNGASASPYSNRVFMGGGGGTGTQDPGFVASNGGHGGGIVIIIADTLKSQGMPILADGDSVKTVATGAGGGGGGGGAILLDVSHYEGNIELSAKGGGGGSTDHGAVYTGPGGGGGGGIYWMRYDSTNVTKNSNPGIGGKSILARDPGFNGLPAGTLTGLNVPLNGFLFNTLPADKIVCSDLEPQPINASSPKGGSGIYDYQWWYLPEDSVDWIKDTENTSMHYYFDGPLTVTTKYKRIVKSAGLEEGDDVFVTYTVLSEVLGNTVQASDTVCFGLEALPFEQHPDSTLRGANVVLEVPDSIRWIRSTDGGSSWSNATGVYSNVGYTPPGLNETTIYSRVINSGVCKDTSNQVTVTVLDPITGNNISQDTMICDGQDPDLLTGPVPGGGDTDDRRYKWMERTEGGSWGEANGTSDEINYDPGALTDTTYYRRIFYSGIQDACIDSSDILTITVLNDISNNLISATPTEMCEGISIPGGIDASKPEDGDLVNYRFEWLESSDGAVWTMAGGSADQEDYDPGVFSDTVYYSRVVRSGLHDVCQDTSVSIKINVLPKITNNIITTAPETKCQGIKPSDLLAGNPGGGNPIDGYNYFWESSLNGEEGSWNLISTNSDTSLDPLPQTTYFRRRVNSPTSAETCKDTSASIIITVQDSITNNRISHDPGYVCFSEELTIDGTSITAGGDGSYSYTWDSISGGSFVTISGAEQSNYTEADFETERSYRRIVVSGECKDTSSVKIITVEGLPVGNLDMVDPLNTIFCERDIVGMKIDITGDGESPYTYEISYAPDDGSSPVSSGSYNSGENIPVTALLYPETASEASFNYSLTMLKDINNCYAPMDDLSGDIDITVFKSPTAGIQNSETEICGDSVYLKAEISEEFYDKTWTTDPYNAMVSFVDPTIDESYAILNRSGEDMVSATFKWKLKIVGDEDTPTCSDSVYYTVDMYERPDAAAIGLIKDEVTTFTAARHDLSQWQNPVNAGDGSWSVEGSDENLNGSTAENLEKYTDYTFYWKVVNGACTPDSASLLLHVKDLVQYEGFSPNGDDWNDIFMIGGLGELGDSDDFTFTIYDSWGAHIRTLVKKDFEDVAKVDQGEALNEIPLWDGKGRDGQMVPDGTYYYHLIVTVSDSREERRGFVIKKTGY